MSDKGMPKRHQIRSLTLINWRFKEVVIRYIFSTFGIAIIATTVTDCAFADNNSKNPASNQVESQLAHNWSADGIQENLKKQGYQIISVGNTFLGRVKIRAKNDHHSRILVMAPYTGEILSDRIFSNKPLIIVTDREGDGNRDGANKNEVADRNTENEKPNTDGNMVSRPSPDPDTGQF